MLDLALLAAMASFFAINVEVALCVCVRISLSAQPVCLCVCTLGMGVWVRGRAPGCVCSQVPVKAEFRLADSIVRNIGGSGSTLTTNTFWLSKQGVGWREVAAAGAACPELVTALGTPLPLVRRVNSPDGMRLRNDHRAGQPQVRTKIAPFDRLRLPVAPASEGPARGEGEAPLKVCYVIPMYNEPFCELSATLRSIAENLEVWRRNPANKQQRQLRDIDATVVIVQDGWGSAHETTKRFLEMDLGCPSAADISRILEEQRHRVGMEVNKPEGVDGVAVMVPEAMVYHTTSRAKQATMSALRPIVITKSKNMQKFDAHMLFAGLCKIIQPDSIFLTDCSTRFSSNCLHLLQSKLLEDDSLVGVTARMRVMSASETFEVSPDSLAFDVDTRHAHGFRSRIARFWLSPAPAQAFEFVSGSVLGTAMYDVLGSLAVLPGPCQLLRWKDLDVEDGPFDMYADVLLRVAKTGGLIKTSLSLAEDRVLSIALSLRCGGQKTKYIVEAEFMFEAETTWSQLLSQRRRWINGTAAVFCYFLLTDSGRREVNSGYSSLAFPRLVRVVWALEIVRLLAVLLSPCFFGMALYESIIQINLRWHVNALEFGPWASMPVGPMLIYFGMYVLFVFLAIFLGKCPPVSDPAASRKLAEAKARAQELSKGTAQLFRSHTTGINQLFESGAAQLHVMEFEPSTVGQACLAILETRANVDQGQRMMCRQFADSQQGRVLLATLRDDAGAEGVLQSLPPAQQGLFRDWRDRRPTGASTGAGAAAGGSTATASGVIGHGATVAGSSPGAPHGNHPPAVASQGASRAAEDRRAEKFKKRQRVYNALMPLVFHLFAMYSALIAAIAVFGMGDAMARSARPTNSHTIGTHGLDVMEIALIVIWGTPLFLAMCTGWSSAWSYFRHTIPYVFLMPMYIGLLTAFALARLDDFSWGNRDSELTEIAMKAETFKCVKWITNMASVVINGVLLAGYIAIVRFYGHPSALFIVYSFVVFLPMAPNIVMSVYFVAKRVLTVFFKLFCRCCLRRDPDTAGERRQLLV